MGYDAKAGNFALNTSTGNQSITGLGFQPKLVIFYPTQQTADGVIVDYQLAIGAAVSSTSRFSVCVCIEDAQATAET